MAKSRTVVATDKHHIRLVQLVPAGTAGAHTDTILGMHWLPTRAGVNGAGGFVQIQEAPVLGDQSDFTITLPPVGNDGVNHQDRFHCLADTPDIVATGRTPYAPGDEWIEVYRGTSDLVALGTPVSWQVQPEQITIVCRDVLQPLRKAQETAGGFWNHAPRDVFEHYSRLWQNVLADDFSDSQTQFPASPSSVSAATPDGRWEFVEASRQGGVSFVRLHGGGTEDPGLSGEFAIPEGGMGDHGCYRVEMRIATVYASTFPKFFLSVGSTAAALNTDPDSNFAQLYLNTATGDAHAGIDIGGTASSYPLTITGLTDSNGHLTPPYTLAIEARERFYLFYVDGQLVGCAPRPRYSAPQTFGMLFGARDLGAGGFMDIDYVVMRRTTAPLNGGDPGDYALPSPPTPGGLSGEYFDMAALEATLEARAWGVAGAPNATNKTTERIDPGLSLYTTAGAPSWQPGGFTGSFYVRWTGAIYLPLADQDIVFTLPSPIYSDHLRLYVGRTRMTEHVISNWLGDSTVSTSVGMRSLFGHISGWYPIVVEYAGNVTHTGSNPAFGWNGPGGGSPIPEYLSPLGCYRGQVNGGSHYDMLRNLIQQFSFQWKGEPRQLESGYFPGAVIPRARVGRDTDLRLDDTDAINPVAVVTGEDFASTLYSQAQGLGGSSSGSLTAELFDFNGMPRHPFLSSEADNSPQTTEGALLIQHMLTLLELRTSPWEDVQTMSTGTRTMQDTFPLTGQLAEFDWAVGDGLRIDLPQIGVVDALPRQIIALQRMLYPDGIGETQASFRPRPRSAYETIRALAKQLVGGRRTFQGQLMYELGTQAVSPAYSMAILPADLSLVREAVLIILSKRHPNGDLDLATTFDVEINGTSQIFGVSQLGEINIGPWLSRNGGIEPRIVARLVNPSAACNVAYAIRLRTLVARQ